MNYEWYSWLQIKVTKVYGVGIFYGNLDCPLRDAYQGCIFTKQRDLMAKLRTCPAFLKELC